MSNRYIVAIYAEGETVKDIDNKEISLIFASFEEFYFKEDAFYEVNKLHNSHGNTIMKGQLEPLRGRVYRFPSNEEIAPLVPKPYWTLKTCGLSNEDYLGLFHND